LKIKTAAFKAAVFYYAASTLWTIQQQHYRI